MSYLLWTQSSETKHVWYKDTTREELLDVIELEDNPSIRAERADSLASINWRTGRITAFWRENPEVGSPVPLGIVVNRGDIRDFIAWAATYINLRPFTAYCRIIDAERIAEYEDLQAGNTALENCLLGMVLAEAVAESSKGAANIAEITPNDCAATLSFALSRAAVLGFSGENLRWVEEDWHRARRLTNSRDQYPHLSYVRFLFETSTALVKENFPLVDRDQRIVSDCARDVLRSGTIQGYNWQTLAEDTPALRNLNEFQHAPREARVSLLRQFLLGTGHSPGVKFTLAVGYLASAIAPGSFEHYQLVRGLEPKIPGVLLAFGFWAGLYRKNSIAGFSGGLGRRVLRELERVGSLYSRPYCDIAIDELSVLLDADNKIGFRLGTPNAMEIELAPCINTVQGFATSQVENAPTVDQNLIREFDSRIAELTKLRNKLAGRPEQEPLFSRSRPKKSGR